MSHDDHPHGRRRRTRRAGPSRRREHGVHRPAERTTWLRTMKEADKAIRDHLETTFYFDEKTGELWEPTLDDLARRKGENGPGR